MTALRSILVALCVIGVDSVATAKDAGDLLAQYLADPKEAAKSEVLALVEIVSIETDVAPERGWKQTGTLHLRTIESVKGNLPETFSVRFFKREGEGEDAWTWDYVVLKEGKRLVGFFNQWEETWAVRKDGRTNVISNPDQIEPSLLRRVQRIFKTPLRLPADKKKRAEDGAGQPATDPESKPEGDENSKLESEARSQ